MEQIRSPIAARRIGAGDRTVVFHADEDWHARISDGQIDFFTALGARPTQEGIPYRLAARGGHDLPPI